MLKYRENTLNKHIINNNNNNNNNNNIFIHTCYNCIEQYIPINNNILCHYYYYYYYYWALCVVAYFK